MPLFAELSLAARRLRRHFGFTTACVTTLGVGIGASVAMFAVVHGIVLNPLPYPDAGKLVQLDHRAPGIGNDGGLGMTPGLYLLYRESSRTLASLAIYSDADVTLTGHGEPRRLAATVTTHELATVLRAHPALGRFLIPADDQPGAIPVTVLSHALWISAGFVRLPIPRHRSLAGAAGESRYRHVRVIHPVGHRPTRTGRRRAGGGR
jgi:putative ABC transport system permease protein